MIVENTTVTKKRMEKRKKRADRVYKGDFENVELAHLAKSCVWMAILYYTGVF